MEKVDFFRSVDVLGSGAINSSDGGFMRACAVLEADRRGPEIEWGLASMVSYLR